MLTSDGFSRVREEPHRQQASAGIRGDAKPRSVPHQTRPPEPGGDDHRRVWWCRRIDARPALTVVVRCPSDAVRPVHGVRRGRCASYRRRRGVRSGSGGWGQGAKFRWFRREKPGASLSRQRVPICLVRLLLVSRMHRGLKVRNRRVGGWRPCICTPAPHRLIAG